MTAAARLRALIEAEATFSAIRAQGAGGQNVNKVSSAVQLRFDIPASSLSAAHKERLLARGDQRLSNEGVLVLKAQAQRTQARNLDEARERLLELLLATAQAPPVRRATQPTRASKRRTAEGKQHRSALKASRSRPLD